MIPQAATEMEAETRTSTIKISNLLAQKNLSQAIKARK